MGGQGSGPQTIAGGQLAERLEDIRWQLLEAEEDEADAVADRQRCERREERARKRRERAEADLMLEEQRLGIKGLRVPRLRVDGLTVTPLGDPTAVRRTAARSVADLDQELKRDARGRNGR